MPKLDKIYIVALVVLVVLLVLKSFVFDPYSPKNEAEEKFMLHVESVVEEKYSGGIYNGLVIIKITKITEMSLNEKTYKDLEGNPQIADGVYKAKIRKYILGILPFSEESILEGVPDED